MRARIVIKETHAEVLLTKGKIALIDLCDVERVSRCKWRYAGHGYAQTHDEGGVTLHQLIMGPSPVGKEIDHENRDKLDCRRNNLRFITHQENILNKEYDYYVGVVGRRYGVSTNTRWQAMINVNGRQIALGSFSSREEAVKVRKKAEVEFYGREFMRVGTSFESLI